MQEEYCLTKAFKDSNTTINPEKQFAILIESFKKSEIQNELKKLNCQYDAYAKNRWL